MKKEEENFKKKWGNASDEEKIFQIFYQSWLYTVLFCIFFIEVFFSAFNQIIYERLWSSIALPHMTVP